MLLEQLVHFGVSGNLFIETEAVKIAGIGRNDAERRKIKRQPYSLRADCQHGINETIHIVVRAVVFGKNIFDRQFSFAFAASLGIAGDGFQDAPEYVGFFCFLVSAGRTAVDGSDRPLMVPLAIPS